MRHGTHTNEFESVIDTVQRRNLWCANSVRTGTTCWKAGLGRLRCLSLQLGKRRLQALRRGCEAAILLEYLGVMQPLVQSLSYCIFALPKRDVIACHVLTKTCRICPDVFFPPFLRFPLRMGKVRLVHETTTHACVERVL